MIPELGHFALVVALFIGLALTVLPVAGAARGDVAWMGFARPAAQALGDAHARGLAIQAAEQAAARTLKP